MSPSFEEVEPAPGVDAFAQPWARGKPLLARGGAGAVAGRVTLERLAEVAGEARVVAAPLRDRALDFDPRRGVSFRRVRLSSFLAALRDPARTPELYVQTPLEQLPEALRRDLPYPVPVARAPWRRGKLWLSGSNVRTQLHFDIAHNVYLQLVGRKRFVLYSPGDTFRLKPRSPFSVAPNFSRLEPGPHSIDGSDSGSARAFRCTLESGDALFIPRIWWHTAVALEPSASVSFWFGGLLTAALSRASDGLKRLRGIYSGEW